MIPSSLTKLWPKCAFRFGGGSAPPPQAAAAVPVPAPAPPVTQTNAAVTLAEQDVARAGLTQKTIAGTILAGDSMGMGAAGKPNQVTSYKSKLG